MSRPIMLFALLLVAPLAARKPLAAASPRTVTFTSPALPAERLLPKLSKAAGVRLTCAPETRADVLLLSVNDAPVPDVLERIAQAAEARWVPNGRGYRLTRPPDLVAEQRDREIQERASVIRSDVHDLTCDLRAPYTAETIANFVPVHPEVWSGSTIRPSGRVDPVWRALLRCLAAVPPEEIAAIPAGGRFVFSTHPRPRQRVMGPGAIAALESLAPEQKLFGETLAAEGYLHGAEDPPRPGLALNEFPLAPHRPWGRMAPYPHSPARALLAIERQEDWEYRVRLKLFDAAGRMLVEFDGGDELIRKPAPEPETPPLDVDWMRAVQLSADTIALFPAVTEVERFPGTMQGPLSSRTRELLGHPERHEPLGLIASDAYLTLARAQHLNLVAALPDRVLVDALRGLWNTPLRLANLLAWLPDRRNMWASRREGWLIIQPSNPYESRLQRADRTVLGRVCRAALRAHQVSFKGAAELAAWSGSKPRDHFSRTYLAAAGGNVRPAMGGRNWSFFRLYGRLTEAQVTACTTKRGLRYADLAPDQKLAMDQLVYGATYQRTGVIRGSVPLDAQSIYNEPTEANPGALPPDAAIRLSRSARMQVVSFLPLKSSIPFWFWTDAPGQFPWTHFPDEFQLTMTHSSSTRYQVRPVTSLRMEVDATPWHVVSEEFGDELGMPSGKPVSIDRLSPDLQAKVRLQFDWLDLVRPSRG